MHINRYTYITLGQLQPPLRYLPLIYYGYLTKGTLRNGILYILSFRISMYLPYMCSLLYIHILSSTSTVKSQFNILNCFKQSFATMKYKVNTLIVTSLSGQQQKWKGCGANTPVPTEDGHCYLKCWMPLFSCR